MAATAAGDDDLDLDTLAAAAQNRELSAAMAAESDLDLAFRLQIAEAMAASLSLVPSSSSAAPPPPPISDDVSTASSAAAGDVSYALGIQALELQRFEQERRDAAASRAEHCRAAASLRVRAHDARFARDVDAMADDEWDEFGDNFSRPISAAGAGDGDVSDYYYRDEEEATPPFRLYFKGMESKEVVGPGGQDPGVAAIVAAVCGPEDELVLHIQKPVPAASRELLEAKALVEGLTATLGLGITRVHVFMDYKALYNHVRGVWCVKQRKVANMINQVVSIQRKFEQCHLSLVPRCHIKFVIKLARDAIDSQITKSVELNDSKEKNETCNICLEINNSSEMHTIDGCLHCFCFSCMKQHVEVKLLHGMLPACPHDGCTTKLSVENSKKFLSPRLLEIMVQRIREEAIPPAEKLYCPYPKCSALMSLSEVIRPMQESSSKYTVADAATLRKCTKCRGSFCINCKVPWHEGMTCYEYKSRYPHARPEDAKLQNLARQKFWRQCVKCKHMIELAEGCFHMTCRCGYEFCYTCGKEWKNKKATCTCPLWDERNIMYDDSEEEEDDYDDEEDDDYDDVNGGHFFVNNGYRFNGYPYHGRY